MGRAAKPSGRTFWAAASLCAFDGLLTKIKCAVKIRLEGLDGKNVIRKTSESLHAVEICVNWLKT